MMKTHSVSNINVTKISNLCNPLCQYATATALIVFEFWLSFSKSKLLCSKTCYKYYTTIFQIFKFLLLKMFSCFWDFKTDFVGSKISVIIKKINKEK